MGTKCLRQKFFIRGTNRCQYELPDKLHCQHPAETVTWTPHDFKLNSDPTLLYISSFTVCSLSLQKYVNLNSLLRETSNLISHKVPHTLRIAPIRNIYFFSDRTRGFIIATPKLSRIITKFTQQLIHSRRYVTNFSLLPAVDDFNTTIQQLYHSYITHHTG